MADVIEKGRFEGALRCRTKSGQEMDVQLCLAVLRDAKAAPVAILGIAGNELLQPRRRVRPAAQH